MIVTEYDSTSQANDGYSVRDFVHFDQKLNVNPDGGLTLDKAAPPPQPAGPSPEEIAAENQRAAEEHARQAALAEAQSQAEKAREDAANRSPADAGETGGFHGGVEERETAFDPELQPQVSTIQNMTLAQMPEAAQNSGYLLEKAREFRAKALEMHQQGVNMRSINSGGWNGDPGGQAHSFFVQAKLMLLAADKYEELAAQL